MNGIFEQSEKEKERKTKNDKKKHNSVCTESLPFSLCVYLMYPLFKWKTGIKLPNDNPNQEPNKTQRRSTTKI